MGFRDFYPPCRISFGKGGFFVTGEYEIMLGGKAVGQAEVCREGLYYRFRCRCYLTGSVICKIVVDWGTEQRSLGVLVPMGNGFGLETRIPDKYFPQAEPKFYAQPKHREPEGKFVPVYPEEPFSYLAQLKNAYLSRRNGQTGVVIR